jgi:hypothetical protein
MRKILRNVCKMPLALPQKEFHEHGEHALSDRQSRTGNEL